MPWKDEERRKEYVRDWHLQRKYGITAATFDEMSAAQGHVCAICGGTCGSYPHLSVDHDHNTGAIRGLLCHACNIAIGKLRDNPTLCDAAAMYLRQYEETNVELV